MHYLIYGTGAVGGYLGGVLSLSGIQITFLARPRVATAIQAHGLKIQGSSFQRNIPEPRVFVSAEQALNQPPPDIILLTVKAYDVEAVAEEIQQFAPAPIPIVCFTNGVGSEKSLSKVLPQHSILPATTTTAVQMIRNGIIQVERERGVGLAGTHPSLPSIAQDMNQADLLVRRYRSPERMKWSKLLTNIVSNATSAILGWPPKRVFNHPDLYRLEVEALRETVQVMRRMDIKPQNLPKVPVSLLSFGIFFPPWMTQGVLGRVVTKGRGSKQPSFHYDIGRGCSEVRWLNGAVVEVGRQLGFPTPANCVLTETMLRLVADSKEHGRFRNRPEELLHLAIKSGVHGIQGYNP